MTPKMIPMFSDEWRRLDLLPVHDCQFRLPPKLLRPDLLVRLVAQNEGHDQTNPFRKLIFSFKALLPFKLVPAGFELMTSRLEECCLNH